MNRLFREIAMVVLMMMSATQLCAHSSCGVMFERMWGFPSAEDGISLGVSACFAGVIGDTLVMAGGCNFPTVPAAESGMKRYYRGIYAAVIDGGNRLDWQLVGWLPEAAAYGVSVPTDEGLLCVGGCNEAGSLRSTWLIKLQDGRASVSMLPMLPHEMDNFTGAGHDGQVMVSDGEQIYALNLNDSAQSWHTVARVGERRLHQAVSGFMGRTFCLWGGMMPKTANHETALQMGGWQYHGAQLPLPGPVDAQGDTIYLGGAATVNLTATSVLAVGGVNHDVFLSAVTHPEPDYMTHPAEWYRFNPYLCLFENGNWKIIGRSPVTARAGAALVKHGHVVYIIGGELKPGVRTPQIFAIRHLPFSKSSCLYKVYNESPCFYNKEQSSTAYD